MKIPEGYAKRVYIADGKVEYRVNPDYPSWHCFTVTECQKCGELFEADREHICKEQNSYPKEAYLSQYEGEKA